ncbi:MAG TPA: peptide MFS transporter [Bacteroidota bacterium]|jgi:POT family proton-dependent oligopeptide transporter|nr:peptide MFS transporter [Bacteroidota bacterium]
MANETMTAASPASTMGGSQEKTFLGHPGGLSTLFFTEMWERFSYYGMRAFLILYMVAPAAAGGLGLTDADAGSIYGWYTGLVWGAAIAGGFVADRFLGQYRSVLVGGIIIMLGHFTLVFKDLPFFYAGLGMIIIGTGLLKPNASTLVGSLYPKDDTRRDAGFSLFYMGINLGALFGPLIAGYLAQKVDWHIGFACAGVGMAFGLIQYVLGRKRLQQAVDRIQESKAQTATQAVHTGGGFTAEEWKRIGAVFIFFIVAIIFWGAYEQAGTTLNLFADRYTRLEAFGFSFPSSWFQSVQPVFVIILAPFFAWLWVRLGKREPSVPAKLAIGVFFMALAFLVLVPAGSYAQSEPGARVSPWWLVLSYAISEFGEICLYPIGLSAVTKLAPPRILGLMMGVWFLSNSFGNKLAGWAAGFFATMPLSQLFGEVSVILLVTAAVMFIFVKPIRKLMGGVH